MIFLLRNTRERVYVYLLKVFVNLLLGYVVPWIQPVPVSNLYSLLVSFSLLPFTVGGIRGLGSDYTFSRSHMTLGPFPVVPIDPASVWS